MARIPADALLQAARGLLGGSDSYPEDAFVTLWDTAQETYGGTDERTIALPLVSDGAYDFTVDWGDGATDTIASADDVDREHTYPEPGMYVVVIRGSIEGWHFEKWPDDSDGHYILAPRLSNSWRSGSGERSALAQRPAPSPAASRWLITATDTPDLSPPVTLQRAFEDCPQLDAIHPLRTGMSRR